MNRLTNAFTFHYPLKQKIVRDLKLVTEHVGELVIEGTGYFHLHADPLSLFDQHSVDIDFVKWNGTDIRPVLQVTGGLEEIEQAAVRFVAGLFATEARQAA